MIQLDAAICVSRSNGPGDHESELRTSAQTSGSLWFKYILIVHWNKPTKTEISRCFISGSGSAVSAAASCSGDDGSSVGGGGGGAVVSPVSSLGVATFLLDGDVVFYYDNQELKLAGGAGRRSTPHCHPALALLILTYLLDLYLCRADLAS